MDIESEFSDMDDEPSAFQREVDEEARYLEALAREKFGVKLGGGARPLKRLDDLFNTMIPATRDPSELAYLAHLFGVYFGRKVIAAIGGQWGMSRESGLQIENLGRRRSVKVVEMCAARITALGYPLPIDPALRSRFLTWTRANPDETLSFETCYDILKREHDARREADGE